MHNFTFFWFTSTKQAKSIVYVSVNLWMKGNMCLRIKLQDPNWVYHQEQRFCLLSFLACAGAHPQETTFSPQWHSGEREVPWWATQIVSSSHCFLEIHWTSISINSRWPARDDESWWSVEVEMRIKRHELRWKVELIIYSCMNLTGRLSLHYTGKMLWRWNPNIWGSFWNN